MVCLALAVAAVAAPTANADGSAGRPAVCRGGPASGELHCPYGGGPAPSSPSPSPGEESQPHVGSVNPLAIRNPFCDAQGLRRTEQRNCRVTGTPEGRYPTSNFGFDVHVDTGVDNISGNFASMIAQIANAIWTFCLFVLNIILTVLGWAFSLSPFTDNEAMRAVDSGLEGFYGAFTEPWLVVAMVVIGAVALYRGVVQREVSQTLASTLLSVVLMIAALWVIHEPRQTIGTLTGYVNSAAVSVLAAPQSGSVANPTGDYGQATDEVWRDMTLPGFAVLDFSDVGWALSEPDPALLATSNRYACADAAYLAQLPPGRAAEIVFGSEHTGGVGPVGGSDHTTCENLDEIAPAPRTNAEIWLRNSPGSLARERLWTEHTDDAPYSSYFAIQGEGGAATRLPLVLLIALGLLGAILLLTWIAVRLFMQTAVAFVLVLLTPLALFLPAFGEGGRRGFASWGATLVGALVSKLVYAALLSVVLLATTVIGSMVDGTGGIGASMAFLAMAALWWAVFLYRSTLLAFLSVKNGADEGHGRLAGLLGVYSMAGLGRQVLGRGGGPGGSQPGRLRRSKDRLLGDRLDRSDASTALARHDVDTRAAKRLDAHLARARSVVAEQDARRARVGELSSRGDRHDREAERHLRAFDEPHSGGIAGELNAGLAWHALGADEARVERARIGGEIEAASAAENNARALIASAAGSSGGRWSRAELGASREELRREADLPVDDRAHAWRVGMSEDSYAALSGEQRVRVHADVADQLRSDRAAFGAIPSRPAGVVGGKEQRRYRRAVRAEPGGRERLRSERTAITKRRLVAYQRARRGVTR